MGEKEGESVVESSFYFVAVHGGAGYHASDSELDLKRAMRLACGRALDGLQAGSEALDAVEAAIVVLEDDPCLNAGFGSNLTLNGTVECDASLMDGLTGDFGAIGAVASVKNPITAARAVLNNGRKPDPLGRIPPSLLVSDGAHAFAKQSHVKCVPADALTCPRALAEFNLWKERLRLAENAIAPPMPTASVNQSNLRDGIQDTVGAIAYDSAGNLAAGVSSGGLLLKHPGRVGEAAVWGAGCWAEHGVGEVIKRGVACSISGSGEYIVRELLAKAICEMIMSSSEVDTHYALAHKLSQFQRNARMRGEDEPIAGVLLLVKENDDEQSEAHPRLWCAFTAHSMAIAYASGLDPKPRAMLLRRPTHRKDDPESHIYITALSLTR